VVRFMILIACAVAAYGAQVKTVVGTVTVNGKPCVVNMEVSEGDTVATSAEAYVELLLYDGTGIRIKENSDLVLQEIKPKKKKGRLEILKGYVLSIVAKGSDYEIRTPTAVAAVRGTVFFCAAGQDADYVCSCNGSITVSPTNSGAHPLTAKHHKAVTVTKEGSIEPAGMVDHTDEEILELLFAIDN